MRRVEVIIRSSETRSASTQVPLWEVDVLKMVHGPEAVTTGEESDCGQEYPDAAAEFDRLARRYAANDEGNPFVVRIYGSASRLGQIIAAVEAGDELGEDEPEVAPIPKRKSGRPRKAPAADSAPESIDE